MVDRAGFDRALTAARTWADRVAFFGALLARDSRLGKRLVVVGGSALSIYTAGGYVSKDVDVFAPRPRVEPTLRRWGFRFEGERERGYWVRADLALLIDIIDRPDYVGLVEGIHTEPTPYGPVRIAAVEDLLLRCLVFALRTRRRELLEQAALLWVRFGQALDREYLEVSARREGVEDLLRTVVERGRLVRPPRSSPRGRSRSRARSAAPRRDD